MKEALHILEPPKRTDLIANMQEKATGIQLRLKQSKKVDQQLAYARKIYYCVMRWYAGIRRRNAIRNAILEQRRKQEEENRKNLEDDAWGRYG